MKKATIGLIFGIFAMLSLSQTLMSCGDEPDCSGSARPLLICKLYNIDAETGTKREIALKTVTVKEAVTDSLIINSQSNVKDLLLPLSYTKTTTRLVFFYENELKDTLTVLHENQPYFLSMDCGYQVKQRIDSIRCTHHSIDSISIINKEVYANGQENIQLFYR